MPSRIFYPVRTRPAVCPTTGLAAVCLLGMVAALCAVSAVSASSGSQSDSRPSNWALRGTDITERLGETAPLDTSFVDEQGRDVRFGDYFGQGRPVILTMNYYRCPHLCKMTLNALVDGLREIDWLPGRDFELVTVSINPDEGPELAKANKIGYTTLYDRPEANDGWHFLTGDWRNIDRLAQGVGFGFRYDERSGEYVHSSTIIFLSPNGRITRYINDLVFPPQTLQLALVEAGEGTVGTFMERILFRCFLRYDGEHSQYVVAAEWMMFYGGLATVIVIGAGLFIAWRKDVRRRRRRSAVADHGSSPGSAPLTTHH